MLFLALRVSWKRTETLRMVFHCLKDTHFSSYLLGLFSSTPSRRKCTRAPIWTILLFPGCSWLISLTQLFLLMVENSSMWRCTLKAGGNLCFIEARENFSWDFRRAKVWVWFFPALAQTVLVQQLGGGGALADANGTDDEKRKKNHFKNISAEHLFSVGTYLVAWCRPAFLNFDHQ